MKPADNRDPQTYAIIGAAMEIHRQLGHGFLEAVYQEAAVVEFPAIVEFKALSRLTNVEETQVLNYLKATRYKRGLLINFGTPSLQYKRLVWGYENPKSV